MRALLCGLALAVLAVAGPVSAWQPEETQPNDPPRSEQPREPRGGERNAGGCQSTAGDIGTAEEFCKKQLNCAAKGMKMKCGGRPNNYSCKCVP